jgi:hypothetical protein
LKTNLIYWEIKIKIQIDAPLQINIEIGKKKGLVIFDKNYLLKGPFFQPLLDFDFFKTATLDFEQGLIIWPNGYGISLFEIECVLKTSNNVNIF